MNNIKDMELTKLSKSELLEKCEELGLTKYKSKNKEALINLIVGTKIIDKNIIKHLKPLIKWSGGKSDEIKMFEKYFPQNAYFVDQTLYFNSFYLWDILPILMGL